MHERERTGAQSLRPKTGRLPRVPVPLPAPGSARLDAMHPDGVLGLQRTAGNEATTALLAGGDSDRSPVHDVVASAGSPLAGDVRADMEARLGQDFSDVRVHTDDAADASARAVHAHAYTVGSHIAFQRSAFDPSSTAGRTTLAHELTHVVQQRAGPVDGAPAPGGIRVSDPADRYEREAVSTAERAVAGPEQVQREELEESDEPPPG